MLFVIQVWASILIGGIVGFSLGAYYYARATRREFMENVIAMHNAVDDLRKDPEFENMTNDDWLELMHELLAVFNLKKEKE